MFNQMPRWLQVAIALSLLWGGWDWYRQRPVRIHTPGAQVTQVPVQTRTETRVTRLGSYELTHLARFGAQALVLSREDYRLDRGATLSPTDLALGWGPMSDPAVLRQLQISQGNRFYFWRYQNQPPVPVDHIVRSSANMHMIPANDSVAQRLRQVRPGQVIFFEGYLVRANAPDGWSWTSSLTREDTGAGACELVLVEDLQLPP